MPNTFAVRTWDLMLPRLSRVLVTNPDRQLLCHFSKTVLRIPSTEAIPRFDILVIMRTGRSRGPSCRSSRALPSVRGAKRE